MRAIFQTLSHQGKAVIFELGCDDSTVGVVAGESHVLLATPASIVAIDVRSLV